VTQHRHIADFVRRINLHVLPPVFFTSFVYIDEGYYKVNWGIAQYLQSFLPGLYLTRTVSYARMSGSNIKSTKETNEHMFINIEIERLRRYMSKADMAKALFMRTDELNDWIYRRRAIPADGLRAMSRLFDGCSIDYLLKERCT
jgi:hypothetical protein